jgi:hypothetical protein
LSEEAEQNESEQDKSEVFIVLIQKERNSCFHIAIAQSNADTDDAKAICSQAILYCTKADELSLDFAVYDSRTQMIYFCLCDPFQQTFEDVSHYSMQSAAEVVAERLKVYIDLNAVVLYE